MKYPQAFNVVDTLKLVTIQYQGSLLNLRFEFTVKVAGVGNPYPEFDSLDQFLEEYEIDNIDAIDIDPKNKVIIIAIH